MTPTDLIRNAMIIISKEMGITPEKAYYFMQHYKEYVDYAFIKKNNKNLKNTFESMRKWNEGKNKQTENGE